MPRKKIRSSPVEKKVEEADDDDFFFDDSQSGSGKSSHEPQHRNAANARERARMRVLAKAFCRLKTTLPWVPADTKLSKLDTLRLAASYIAHLRALLHEPRSAHTPPHPLSLAWPFTFQHGTSLSCTISQRWNINRQTDSSRTTHGTDLVQNGCTNFEQEYENEYDDRSYDPNECENQYCNYGYYGMRSYEGENLMNS